MKKIEIIAMQKGKVLTVLSQEVAEISFNMANSLLRKKDIRINDVKISKNIDVNDGDKITAFLPEDLKLSKKYEIIFNDENVLIVNKFKGIEVADGELNLISEIKNFENFRVFAVHRLDRNTEGLVIMAKNKDVQKLLEIAIKKEQIKKYYLTEVVGSPKKDEVEEIAYLLKDAEKSEVKIFSHPIKGGNIIKTKYKVIKRSGGTSLLEVELIKGKTHQIRAHLAYLGLPIIGDGKYGSYQQNRKYKEKTQKLVAYKITFQLEKTSPLAYLNDKIFEIEKKYLSKMKEN